MADKQQATSTQSLQYDRKEANMAAAGNKEQATSRVDSTAEQVLRQEEQ
jgi:hypothetical protein